MLVVDPKKGNGLRVTIGNDPTIRQVRASHYSHVEVLDGAGNRGVGTTNLKRMFGHPDELRLLVTALAGFVNHADALAAADSGAAPLTAALAFRVALPVVFVRSTPKTHFLSYSGDPQSNHPLLSGEQLPARSRVVIIDDLPHSGWREPLQHAGLESVSALALTTDL